ncbi:circadian clock protein KaiA [Parasynechococcus marenigrum]|uniref:Circadian clock oscillator protein KaiA n=1 Tax=Parasynechococcus marenigrum (strain WH8102) TaxID=84588 RepID=KAIA_PARMW|nr:circadian clock protein KaiA [Parasynechococcus marenigrum]Q7U8R5.1 RecName: Full=Circadian clock oscillator protein KaiA [Parasynechococcus marenigrum WH 8102]CAE07063.1 possible circadian clock protein KaiA [UI:98397326] [Parasynechococcus marenigrum WH 8102]
MARPGLTIALLLTTPNLVDACQQWLPDTRYHSIVLSGPHQGQEQLDLVSTLEAQQEEIDAVVVEQQLLDASSRDQLLGRGLLFPAVVVGEMKGHVDYHAEELHLAEDQLAQLGYTVDAAISRFLRQGRADGRSDDDGLASVDKLSRRLQERLGYLGVFYKRDPSRFLGSLPTEERRELLESLQRTYRDLLISYFSDPAASNQALESFVNTAFFSDLPITRTVDIHVDQIDEFWKQLRLEGNKSEFLQDYRLALLDVMAHLCEMYRRSIPPDIPLSGLASGRHRREADLPDAPEVSS